MAIKHPKKKGYTFEKEMEQAHLSLGIQAERQPMSGALKGKYKSDLQIAGMYAECKRRKKSFTSLYKALAQDDSDILFVRDDEQPPLAVLPWKTWKLFLSWSKIAENYPATINKENENE